MSYLNCDFNVIIHQITDDHFVVMFVCLCLQRTHCDLCDVPVWHCLAGDLDVSPVCRWRINWWLTLTPRHVSGARVCTAGLLSSLHNIMLQIFSHKNFIWKFLPWQGRNMDMNLMFAFWDLMWLLFICGCY